MVTRRRELATVEVKDPLTKVVELRLGKDFNTVPLGTPAADCWEWSDNDLLRGEE